mgnify:CR=1 FL=1
MRSVLVLGSQLPGYLRFRNALRRPEAAQRKVLRGVLGALPAANAATGEPGAAVDRAELQRSMTEGAGCHSWTSRLPPTVVVTRTACGVDRDRRRALLSHLIKQGDWQQVLVFTRTKHGANRLAEQLTQDGIEADAIHGNKSQNARTRALEAASGKLALRQEEVKKARLVGDQKQLQLRSLETRIKDGDAKRNGAKTNREYQLLGEQLEADGAAPVGLEVPGSVAWQEILTAHAHWSQARVLGEGFERARIVDAMTAAIES